MGLFAYVFYACAILLEILRFILFIVLLCFPSCADYVDSSLAAAIRHLYHMDESFDLPPLEAADAPSSGSSDREGSGNDDGFELLRSPTEAEVNARPLCEARNCAACRADIDNTTLPDDHLIFDPDNGVMDLGTLRRRGHVKSASSSQYTASS